MIELQHRRDLDYWTQEEQEKLVKLLIQLTSHVKEGNELKTKIIDYVKRTNHRHRKVRGLV